MNSKTLHLTNQVGTHRLVLLAEGIAHHLQVIDTYSFALVLANLHELHVVDQQGKAGSRPLQKEGGGVSLPLIYAASSKLNPALELHEPAARFIDRETVDPIVVAHHFRALAVTACGRARRFEGEQHVCVVSWSKRSLRNHCRIGANPRRRTVENTTRNFHLLHRPTERLASAGANKT
eukprot:1632485-Rhodomonas_salina.3